MFYASSEMDLLLSALIWCSASTSVFLIYPWREKYSMSTYSSTILFSPATHHDSDFQKTFLRWFLVLRDSVGGGKVEEMRQ